MLIKEPGKSSEVANEANLNLNFVKDRNNG